MPDQPHSWTVETGVGGILVAVPPSQLEGPQPSSLDVDGGALGAGAGILRVGGYDRGTIYGGSGSRLIGPYGQGPNAGAGSTSFASRDTAIVHSGDAALRYTFAAGGQAADWQGIITNDPTVGNFCLPMKPGVVYRFKASARTDSIAGSPSWRLVFTHDVLGTLVSSKTVPFAAANAWETTEFAFAVPAGAGPNTKLAIQFQRGATGAQDFWIDSIRADEVGYAAGMFDEASGKPRRAQDFSDGKFALKASDTVGKETDDDIFIDAAKTVKVGTVASPSALTKTLRIHHAEFVPADQTSAWHYSGLQVQPGNLSFQTFYAPVVLPPGVTVTKLRMRAYRQTTGKIAECTLWKVAADSLSSLVTVAHDTTGWQTKEGTLSQLVGGEAYAIELSLSAQGGGAGVDARLQYAELEYTMPDYSKGV
jgi:hypothetical protein